MPDGQSLLRSEADAQTSAPGKEAAVFLFAFARADRAPPIPAQDVREPLRFHRLGDIVALICAVPIADYVGADGERNLADASWLAPRVRRHADVLQWTTGWSAVFPAPFGTLYRSLESLTDFMRVHESAIAGFLASVAGKEEWELRADARFNSPELLDRLACEARPEWKALPKGVRYMRVCRDREALLKFGREDAAAIVRGYVEELRPFASAIRELAPGRRPESGAGESVARYAVLVERADAAELSKRVQAMTTRGRGEHVSIALAGPWPPFSFRPDLGAQNAAR